MDIKELRQKTDKELAEMIAELRERLRHMRFEIAAEALKDVREARAAKKALSRALTVVSERLTAGSKATKSADKAH